jgi:hypothetical protein
MMAASLPNLAVVEQQTVIRYLWSEGIKTFTVYREMFIQYGDK